MLKNFKNLDIEFDYYEFKNNNILSPILEIYRGKLYLYMLKKFITDCVETFNQDIFNFKKSYVRTLTNLLSIWFFSLYSNYNFKNDSFFPSNYKNTKIIEQIINDYASKHFENVNQKIKKIVTNLTNNYKNLLINLNNYKNSNYFFKNSKNFVIKKELKKINYEYYSFTINVNFQIKDNKLKNLLNNIFIPKDVYDRCKLKYTGLKKYLDTNLWIILFRYQLLGSNNHQLAVLPRIINKMKLDFNLSFECFASSINSISKNYCSIYYDIEKYFGSKGNFFNLKPKSGTYSFNPPYQSDIITNGINKLFLFLEEAYKNKKKLNFIITIPIWDIKGKEIMKETDNGIDYGEFEIVNKIKKNKFFKGLKMISKKDFTYLDHNFKLYKDITIQNTYVIILSSCKNNNFIEKIDNYNFKKNYEIEI